MSKIAFPTPQIHSSENVCDFVHVVFEMWDVLLCLGTTRTKHTKKLRATLKQSYFLSRSPQIRNLSMGREIIIDMPSMPLAG